LRRDYPEEEETEEVPRRFSDSNSDTKEEEEEVPGRSPIKNSDKKSFPIQTL